jgi:two-component system heavy metal sensor histidine kinase CusS
MRVGAPRIRARSIRAQLTITLGLIAVAVFAIAGGALYFALSAELAAVDRIELRRKEQLVSHYIDEASAGGSFDELKHHIDDAVLAHGHLRVWLLSDRGDVILGSGEVPRETDRDGDLLTLRAADGVPLEGIRSAVSNQETLPIATMLVTIDVEPRMRLLARYRAMLWLVFGSGLLLVIGLAAWTTSRGLAPVRRLSEQAARIAPDSLSIRLETSQVGAELTEFVQAFNEALDRVMIAYRKMETFNADVAHELRTPLATLINAAQVTLTGQRSSHGLRETLTDQLEELEQLKALVNDMLFLARADQGDQAQDATRVDLAEEARRTVEYYEALLAETGLSTAIAGEATVQGNPGLIRRALSNLLSNAIKQTRRGETIRFTFRREPGFGVAEVFNPGVAISDVVRARMFDRFFRADPVRNQRGANHGLGLAIVKAIAEMHRGQVFAHSSTTGNTVGFRIPVSAVHPT